MSEASLDRKPGLLRDLRDDELAVIRKMISRSGLEEELEEQLVRMKVQNMPDGGMGSLAFYNGRPRSLLEYGGEIAEAAFQDADGVPVSVMLYVDKDGELFELDVFKADGSPLIRYPDPKDLAIIDRDAQGNVVSAE
jgi:hypothetical protein